MCNLAPAQSGLWRGERSMEGEGGVRNPTLGSSDRSRKGGTFRGKVCTKNMLIDGCKTNSPELWIPTNHHFAEAWYLEREAFSF